MRECFCAVCLIARRFTPTGPLMHATFCGKNAATCGGNETKRDVLRQFETSPPHAFAGSPNAACGSSLLHRRAREREGARGGCHWGAANASRPSAEGATPSRWACITIPRAPGSSPILGLGMPSTRIPRPGNPRIPEFLGSTNRSHTRRSRVKEPSSQTESNDGEEAVLGAY